MKRKNFMETSLVVKIKGENENEIYDLVELINEHYIVVRGSALIQNKGEQGYHKFVNIATKKGRKQ